MKSGRWHFSRRARLIFIPIFVLAIVTCSFIMANRLTHDNLEHNPSASFLFIEEGKDVVGKRLSLIVGEEEFDPEKIKAIRRQNNLPISEEECRFLVHFHIEGVRPLIGNEP